jgi:hypothetical protein
MNNTFDEEWITLKMPREKFRYLSLALALGMFEDLSLYEFIQEIEKISRRRGNEITLGLTPDVFYDRLLLGLTTAAKWDGEVVDFINELNEGNPEWEPLKREANP